MDIENPEQYRVEEHGSCASMDLLIEELSRNKSTDPTDAEWAAEESARWHPRTHDRPFDPSLTLAAATSIIAALGIHADRKQAANAAMHAIIAGLISLERSGEANWLFYSRDDQHYCGLRRYVPQFYRRKTMIRAVDRLQAAGLIEHEQTKPSPSARYRSRLRATQPLRELLTALPASSITHVQNEVIVLRNADGRPIPYRETRSTNAMRRDVRAHNDFLQGFEIVVDHPEAHYDAQGYLIIGSRRIDTGRNAYRRVFKVNFKRVGRWYGPWWQNVPSRIRQGIRINGDATCEPDIRACHMRLLCAVAGIELGDGDPYDGLGPPRAEVKLAINIMLNARNWSAARGALALRLSNRYGPAVGIQINLLRNAIERRFPTLARFWNADHGVILQKVDADVCARLQQTLREQRVPCLSIHDSFVVPESARDLAERAMAEEFEGACQRLRAKH